MISSYSLAKLITKYLSIAFQKIVNGKTKKIFAKAELPMILQGKRLMMKGR
jgi:hypothetical protein